MKRTRRKILWLRMKMSWIWNETQSLEKPCCERKLLILSLLWSLRLNNNSSKFWSYTKLSSTDLSLEKFWISTKVEYFAVHRRAINIVAEFSTSHIWERVCCCLTSSKNKNRNHHISAEKCNTTYKFFLNCFLFRSSLAATWFSLHGRHQVLKCWKLLCF
jgi:hypothetical protein